MVLAAPAPVPVLAPPLPLLNPLTVPQFVNALPNPLVDAYVYKPTDAATDPNHYDVGMYPIAGADLGLGRDPVSNAPRLTNVFGYGTSLGTASYPGKTFVVQKGTPVSVTWSNSLPGQHVVPIDPSLLDATTTYDPVTNSIAGGIPAVPHLHGGHTDAAYDGTPLQYWNAGGVKGADYQYNSYVYANDQDASTLWYHDHAMGVTRLNAYAGLAGFYLIRDGADSGLADDPATPAYDGNALRLPAGAQEVPIVIQDKQFLSDGRLWFPANQTAGQPNVASVQPEMFGDTIVVNGKAWPKLDVQPKRYRLRLLNGSDSRFYTMTIANAANPGQSATPFWQIGTDDGLLNAPVKLGQLTLAPGERMDVIVDFSKFRPGAQFILTNGANTPFPGGTKVVAGLTDRIMAFNVVKSDGTPDASAAPAALTNLRGADPVVALAATTPGTRQVALYETIDSFGRILPLLGTPISSQTFMDPITENIAPGATEVWEIYNNTPDAHPIHLHQVKFQVVSRQMFGSKVVAGPTPGSVAMGAITLKGAPAAAVGNELAYKDTIQVMPGEVVKVRATFDLEGKYVWHCHILSHEEHDMMRFMQVGGTAFPTPRNVYTPPPPPPVLVAADTGTVAPLATTFGAARIGATDVLGSTPEDTLAGSSGADVLV